ncbi:MAG: DNA polymerase III subunit gamma/tau [Candidatus Harrisonbacteria bacterium]|nr:DNA polymerase III subunit gamma/tau [Candidatus Harrisonbacteria bacterium]
MKLALYRKYRPKTFADIVGQPELVTVIQNAARADKLSHAYLFYGPRGTGKTTSARLVAKLANCETRRADASFKKQSEPCNRCRPCAEIDAGTALDVIEIDAASNRGVDEIRDLKEGIRLSPTSYAYKVFIIDEMHMLTREAFNALLKTLEEPPAHAMLILATTEYDKVPATITSRTQRFHFGKLPVATIVEKLSRIAREEKMKAGTDVLELIASASEGSLRDAESLLDQAFTSSGGLTDIDAVERLIGKVGERVTAEVAELLLQKSIPKTLEYLSRLYEGGHNVTDLTKALVNYFRRVLALKFDPALEMSQQFYHW